VVALIGVCDSLFYRTILKAVLPSVAQILPDNVLKVVRKFADDVAASLQYSLRNAPDNLVYVKMRCQ